MKSIVFTAILALSSALFTVNANLIEGTLNTGLDIVGGALELVSGLLKLLKDVLKQLSKIVTEDVFLEKLLDNLKKVVGILVELVNGILFGAGGKILQKVNDLLNPFIIALGKLIINITSSTEGTLCNLIKEVMDLVKVLNDGLIGLGNVAISKYGKKIEVLLQDLLGLLCKVLTADIQKIIKDIVDKVTDGADEATKKLAEELNLILEDIIENVGDLAEAVKDEEIAEILKKFKDSLNEILQKIEDGANLGEVIKVVVAALDELIKRLQGVDNPEEIIKNIIEKLLPDLEELKKLSATVEVGVSA